MFVYLDSSGLVKRYIAEAEAEDVDAVMNDAVAVGTSLITRTEVAAALAKAVRQGRLNEDDGRKAHRRFLEEWPDFGRVPVTDALAARADELTWTHALRGYDAMQLAAALACQDLRGTQGGRAVRVLRRAAPGSRPRGRLGHMAGGIDRGIR